MDYNFLKKSNTITPTKIDYSFLAPNLKNKTIFKTPDKEEIKRDLEKQGVKQGVMANFPAGVGEVFSDIGGAIKGGVKKFISGVKEEISKTPEDKAKEYSARAFLGLEGGMAKEMEIKKFQSGTSSATANDIAEYAKKNEEKTEKAGKIFTAPIRWTAGSLSTALVSLGLQKAKDETGQSLEYDPKTDAEKLIIGENKIKPLLEQEDLYGTIASGAGVPAALVAMAILENPFLSGTGIGGGIKTLLKKKLAKEGEKAILKMGTKEIINFADEAIKKELKAKNIINLTPEQATNALKQIETVKKDVLFLEAPKEKYSVGEGFIMKEKTGKEEIKKAKLFTDYNEKLKSFNKNPTPTKVKSLQNLKSKIDEIKIAETTPTTPAITPKQPQIETIDTKVGEVKAGEPFILNIEPKPNKIEKLLTEPSIPTRIKNESIEKGLIDNFKGIDEYNKVSFKDQAKLVGDIIDQNPEKAIKIALGEELPTNGALPESVLIAVKNQAIAKKDTELLIKLATTENGVAREATVLGQRIKMLDEQLEDDAFKNIKKVADNRRKYIEKKVGKVDKKGELNKIKEEVKKQFPKKDEWASFVEELKC